MAKQHRSLWISREIGPLSQALWPMVLDYFALWTDDAVQYAPEAQRAIMADNALARYHFEGRN